MKKKQSINIDDTYLARIIDVAYGDASLLERYHIYRDAATNPEVKKLLDEYKQTAKSVHSIEEDEFPEKSVEQVYDKIGLKDKNEKYIGETFLGALFVRPALASLVGIFLIVAIISLFVLNKPDVQFDKRQYSQTEVQLAEQQLKESLAIIGKVFKSTQIKLESDILGKQVSEPIQKGFKLLNDMIGG